MHVYTYYTYVCAAHIHIQNIMNTYNLFNIIRTRIPNTNTFLECDGWFCIHMWFYFKFELRFLKSKGSVHKPTWSHAGCRWGMFWSSWPGWEGVDIWSVISISMELKSMSCKHVAFKAQSLHFPKSQHSVHGKDSLGWVCALTEGISAYHKKFKG